MLGIAHLILSEGNKDFLTNYYKSMSEREKAKLKFTTYLKKTAMEAAKANGGKFQRYSDEELFDACYIFMEILVARSFEKFEHDTPTLEAVAMGAPQAFHEFVEAVTGVKIAEALSKRALGAAGNRV
jgi:hypothetical protein